jgi:SAM-dependent methyltransferase
MDVVEQPASINSYVIDAESGAEVARLIEQDRFLNTYLGGPVPERDDLTSMHTMLDLACGPGSWALEVAYCYPRLQVTGVDVSRSMIDFARIRARTQGLDNAHFQVMDITQPLDVDDETFDLVNGRLLVGVLSREAWLPLLRECLRVLRPGGILRLTECELSVTTFDHDDPFGELLWCVKAEPPCRVGFDPTFGSAGPLEHGLVDVLIHPWCPLEQRAPDEPSSIRRAQREDDTSNPALQERLLLCWHWSTLPGGT